MEIRGKANKFEESMRTQYKVLSRVLGEDQNGQQLQPQQNNRENDGTPGAQIGLNNLFKS